VATGSTQRGGVEGKKGTLSCTGPLPRVVGWETNERCPQITLCFVLVMIETALFLFQEMGDCSGGAVQYPMGLRPLPFTLLCRPA
jgi:hypothetical protein